MRSVEEQAARSVAPEAAPAREPVADAPRVINFGCRLNAYEADVMRSLAGSAALGSTVIINTCAVTGEAVRQSMQAVRRMRREHPHARIVVTGCAAQIETDRFAAMPEVDHVIGNAEKMQADAWRRLALGEAERVLVNDIMSVTETAGHLAEGFGTRARAYVQIQNGCNHRCTFCIIPFGRGPSRSVPAGEVVRQVRSLVETGYAEIVLTGVDITSYGADLPGEMTLGRLVQQVLAHVPELKRLRLSSIDQVEVDHQLMHAIATQPRLMPHLHLSLQAGDDMILKRMKRRHCRDDAIRFCEQVRRLRPDVTFGADLIAGFPTETEAMFGNTLDLVDRCGLAFLHVFPFSPREGTPAARMPQVARREIKARAAKLREKGERALACHLERQVGRTIEVLGEQDRRGRAADFSEILLDTSLDTGSLGWARVTGHDGRRLVGEVIA
jgi:threonylcarbamoyladenosine tRNA methylthiotransferase MtaB